MALLIDAALKSGKSFSSALMIRKESMEDQLLRALLTEYEQLSSSFDKHATVGYTAFPLILTAVGGYLVFRQNSGELEGIGILLLLGIAVTWVGISHSILNRIGLRLVAIELTLRTGIGGEMREGPLFFTSYVAQGAPGLSLYIMLLGLSGLALVAHSTWRWSITLVAWQWPLPARIVGIALPIAFIAIPLANVYFVERKIDQRRLDLLRQFNGIEQSNTSEEYS